MLSAGVERDFVLRGDKHPLLLTSVLSGGHSKRSRREQWGEVSRDEEDAELLVTSSLDLSLRGFIAMGNNL